MTPLVAIYLLWLVWITSWIVAAMWVSPTIKHAGLGRELLYRLLVFAGYVFLFGFVSTRYDMLYRVWRTQSGTLGWIMVALVAIGFTFSWWARIHLGPLWSSSVTRKSSHRVIDTGPYSVVRHPIYTGITLAALATAIVHGAPTSFFGVALMTTGWYVKARLEERFLREELGPEAYDAYARRVAMLVPFVRWPG
ncbi:MAG: isoprenylcysteine carboxylmethyltransferase family protein [Alphaproteobacteria bacterium]|nr:isoprenylcysteine carboxylmethyltransferase family protein [Alphaproteobacteria bacterium]MDE1986172.1 isoprenylcysteine carboxylmethyltransferase family protein [Alphaproteobacteria bacterium]MDE2164509.1 isoprenylcysteine carboxylmethyltransferase family protein [Alphaproteobacteria bacterium]MDE2265078.1 isoprenylcysteine carboxylmethyltransferase family protein [Alphaproteobacteria bacterium]